MLVGRALKELKKKLLQLSLEKSASKSKLYELILERRLRQTKSGGPWAESGLKESMYESKFYIRSEIV